MTNADVVLLSNGELYDIIVEVVGDETSREFCTLSDYYLEDNDLDLAMRSHGTDWDTISPLIDEVEAKAKAKREQKRADAEEVGGDA